MQVNWCIFYPFRTVAVTANNSVREDIKSWKGKVGNVVRPALAMDTARNDGK